MTGYAPSKWSTRGRAGVAVGCQLSAVSLLRGFATDLTWDVGRGTWNGSRT